MNLKFAYLFTYFFIVVQRLQTSNAKEMWDEICIKISLEKTLPGACEIFFMLNNSALARVSEIVHVWVPSHKVRGNYNHH